MTHTTMAATLRIGTTSSGWHIRDKMEFEHKVGALDDEDLVVGDKEEKNWKGIVISLLVIGSILGAIIVAIILCTPSKYYFPSNFMLAYDT